MPQWSLTFEVRKRWQPDTKSWLDGMPQWSLTFEVRKSSAGRWKVGRVEVAAMEPDLEVRKRHQLVRLIRHIQLSRNGA